MLVVRKVVGVVIVLGLFVVGSVLLRCNGVVVVVIVMVMSETTL